MNAWLRWRGEKNNPFPTNWQRRKRQWAAVKEGAVPGETSWSSGGFCASWYLDVCFARHCFSVRSQLTKWPDTWFRRVAKTEYCRNLVVKSFISRRVAVCTAEFQYPHKLGEVTVVLDIIFTSFLHFHRYLNAESGDRQWRSILAIYCLLAFHLWMVDTDTCSHPRTTSATASQAGMGKRIQL